MSLEVGLLILGIMFIIAAMFSLGRSRKRSAQGKVTARDNLERARQRQGVRDDLESLMVDIEQMARRLSAQLDAKAVQVEKANREADERIAQLLALREQLARPGDPQAMDLTDPAPAPSPGDPAEGDPLTHQVYALADQGLGPGDIARQLNEHAGKVELILALRKA
ncbi:MAG: hypothetical protein AAGH88_08295 [Planctomycetota bacterium]